VSAVSNLLAIKCDFEKDSRQFYEKIKNNEVF
jgi:hypothetical protein